MRFLPKNLFDFLVFSQCMMSLPLTANYLEPPSAPYTMDGTQVLRDKTASVIDQVLSIPENQITFDNTLGAWQRLIEELSLNAAQNSLHNFSLSFVTDLQKCPEFYLRLRQNALQVLNGESDIFQRHIARCFLENSEKKNDRNILHLDGIVGEKNSDKQDFTIIDFAIGSISKNHASELTEKILETSADIVCLRMISTTDSIFLFDALKNTYAHIYVATSICGKEFSGIAPYFEESIFIASKYSLKNMQFRPLLSNRKNRVLDFVIQNNAIALGHVYTTSFNRAEPEEMRIMQSEKMIEYLQRDFLEISQSKNMPFLICGDLGQLDTSNVLINEYFCGSAGKNVPALLFQSLPSHLNDSQYALTATPIHLSNDRSGLFTRIQEKETHSIDDILKTLSGDCWSRDTTILCGQVDVSAGADRDKDGSKSFDLSISTSSDTERGSFTVEVGGSVSTDKDGNTSGRIESTATFKW